MPRFLLLMLEDDQAWDALPRARQDALYQQYVDFTKTLRDDGRLVDGAPAAPGVVLRQADGQTTCEPDTRTRQVPTGYFIVEADDLDHAATIGRSCPALTHGETVAVHPLDQHGG